MNGTSSGSAVDDQLDRTSTTISCFFRRRTRHLLIQAIFLLLGIGILVPWNAFISAKSYFQSRLCGTDSNNLNVESTFAMVYNLASVISLGLLIGIQALRDQCIAEKEQEAEEIMVHHNTITNTSNDALSNNNPVEFIEREDGGYDITTDTTTAAQDDGHSNNEDHSVWLVIVPLSLYLAAFLGQTFMVFSVNIKFFFSLTILSLAICGMACGIAQAGVVATASLFTADLAMNPYLAGQSVGGVAVSFVNFIAAVMEDPNEYRDAHCETDNINDVFNEFARQSQYDTHIRLLDDQSCTPYSKVDTGVFLYFLLGSLLLFACLIGYSFIGRLKEAESRDNYESVRSVASLTDAVPRNALELHTGKLVTECEQQISPTFLDDPLTPDEPDGLFNDVDPANETVAVWVHIKCPAICIFLTFFVTLALFPGWTSELQSIHQCRSHFRIANDLYTPFTFLLFNIGDLVGRLLLARFPLQRVDNIPAKLMICSGLRFIFFPALFLCNGGSGHRLFIPSDLYSVLIQFAFAVSNGFLLSASFVAAPGLIPQRTDMQERMSEILSFAVAFGLLCGSLFSFPVSKLVG